MQLSKAELNELKIEAIVDRAWANARLIEFAKAETFQPELFHKKFLKKKGIETE